MVDSDWKTIKGSFNPLNFWVLSGGVLNRREKNRSTKFPTGKLWGQFSQLETTRYRPLLTNLLESFCLISIYANKLRKLASDTPTHQLKNAALRQISICPRRQFLFSSGGEVTPGGQTGQHCHLITNPGLDNLTAHIGTFSQVENG